LEIATGQELVESEYVPMFVSEAVTALIDTLKKTTQLANLKHQSLKVVLKVLILHCVLSSLKI